MTFPAELEERFHEARLARQADRSLPQPYWRRDVAEPLAEWLRAEGGYAACEVHGPFGIMHRCSVTLAGEGEDITATDAPFLMIEPILDKETGRMGFGVVDMSRRVHEVVPGSIGEMNGMQYAAVPIPADASAADVLALAGLEPAAAAPRL